MKRTTAPNSAGGLFVDEDPGTQIGTSIIAEDGNNVQEEICHPIELLGVTLDGTDQYQLEKAIIGLGTPLGFEVFSTVEQTPVTWAGARSNANPSNPTYLPIISRAADVDVTTSQAPLLVPFFRGKKLKIVGTTDFTATVSGSTLTFANTTANNALLNAISEDALVQRWFSSGQSATFAASGVDFTNGRCINVNGSDYAITGINVGARTITVSGSPSSGSQTVIMYPYRIASSTTSIRLHKLTGFVPAGAGDADGQYGGALRAMDRGQDHAHPENAPSANGGANGATQPIVAGSGRIGGAIASGWYVSANNASGSGNQVITDAPTANGQGTPRTGKTTDPRAYGVYIYTWAGRLIA